MRYIDNSSVMANRRGESQPLPKETRTVEQIIADRQEKLAEVNAEIASVAVSTSLLDYLELDLDWRDEGACALPPSTSAWDVAQTADLFFHGGDNDRSMMKDSVRTLAAKAICETCPVIEQCLQFSIQNNEEFGVWGGMSSRERKPLIREYRLRHPIDKNYSLRTK